MQEGPAGGARAPPQEVVVDRPHLPHVTLNTDGQRHPRENALAAVAVALAVVSLLCAFAPDLHFVGSAAGLVGVLVGVFDQYVSATRAERMVIVPAIVGSALGLALGVANGGFGL